MIEIVIPKSITPSRINDLYSRYIRKPPPQIDTFILPSSIRKYSFGLLADLLKFVITLNNCSPIRTLKVDLEEGDLNSLYDQEYAYPIISLLWNTSHFIDRNGSDIKSLLRDKQNEFFIIMNSLSRIKGNKYTLTNTDHIPKHKGLVRLLENAKGFNDDEELITKSIRKIFNNNVLIFNKSNITEISEIVEDIGAIVYELTKNTYEWGKTDANLIDLPISIRGVYFRFHINELDKIKEEFNRTPLKLFFEHPYILNNCINSQNKIYYLELLVFDSGIGFIDRFNKTESWNDLEIIKKCLVKNQTSSTSNLKTKKGIGLDRILNTLDKKGFLRICTDKYCVYRDLIKDNYMPIDPNKLDELKLQDWNVNNFNSDNISKARGSYINILYPFKASN